MKRMMFKSLCIAFVASLVVAGHATAQTLSNYQSVVSGRQRLLLFLVSLGVALVPATVVLSVPELRGVRRPITDLAPREVALTTRAGQDP